MGRLYYEETKEALEVMKSTDGSIPKHKRIRSNLEKVAKLVPAEIIAAYLTILGFIPMIDTMRTQLYISFGSVAFCTILTPIYMYKMSSTNKPVRVHLLLSTLAFLVWAYVISGRNFYPIISYDPAIASCLMVAFSLVSGLIPLRK